MDLGEIYRRLVRNAGLLIGSRAVFGLLNLATNALVVRAFGLGDLGVVLLLHVYARLFSDIAKFQSWQAVLRYGAELEQTGARRPLRRLLGFTLAVDLAGAALAVGGAILLLPWAAETFGWPAGVAAFAPVYVFAIPFIMQGTPQGVLRLFDRVDVIAGQHGLNAVLRFAGVGAAALAGGSVAHLVLAWFAASVLSGAWVVAMFLRELARRRLMPSFRGRWLRAGEDWPGIWRFMWSTNLASSLNLGVGQATTMIVGARLGAEAAAAFEIARQFANALGKPARMLGPLIFPDLARLTARGEWRSVRRLVATQLGYSALAIGAVGAVLFVALGPVVGLVYGPELLGEIWLFRLTAAAALIVAAGFALEPAFLSDGRAGFLLGVQAAATAGYLALLALLLPAFGLAGAGLAILAHSAGYHGVLAAAGHRLLSRRIDAGPAGGAAARVPEDAG